MVKYLNFHHSSFALRYFNGGNQCLGANETTQQTPKRFHLFSLGGRAVGVGARMDFLNFFLFPYVPSLSSKMFLKFSMMFPKFSMC